MKTKINIFLILLIVSGCATNKNKDDYSTLKCVDKESEITHFFTKRHTFISDDEFMNDSVIEGKKRGLDIENMICSKVPGQSNPWVI